MAQNESLTELHGEIPNPGCSDFPCCFYCSCCHYSSCLPASSSSSGAAIAPPPSLTADISSDRSTSSPPPPHASGNGAGPSMVQRLASTPASGGLAVAAKIMAKYGYKVRETDEIVQGCAELSPFPGLINLGIGRSVLET